MFGKEADNISHPGSFIQLCQYNGPIVKGLELAENFRDIRCFRRRTHSQVGFVNATAAVQYGPNSTPSVGRDRRHAAPGKFMSDVVIRLYA